MTLGAAKIERRRSLRGFGTRFPEWTSADRRELITLALYWTAIVLLSDVLNVRLGVELMTVFTALAAALISRRGRLFARDWWFLLAGLILWNLSGPIARDSPLPVHLDFMLNAERLLFFGNVPSAVLQRHLAPTLAVGPLDWLTAIAYNAHIPELYIAGYFLWRINRLIYLRFAAAALVLLVLGFITFIVFPAAPPWMASSAFGRIHGVVNRFGLVIHAHPLPLIGTPFFYLFHFRGDAVAAFPSEHAAFPLLEMLAFWCAAGRRVGLSFALWVAWILFSIVYLGEHWVVDALAGYIYALVIWWTVGRLTMARRR